MNENGKVGCLYSWPMIIIALCVFWPVGIFLIVKRVSVDKKAAMGAGKPVSYTHLTYSFNHFSLPPF